jgi:predicted transcriptional regulator
MSSYPSEAEIDILMCRLQGAILEDNKERIQEIINEAKEIVKRVEATDE